jgi:hypothetical protein
MKHGHSVLTPMDPNVKLDLAEDCGEKELKDITDYETVMGSLMYTALASRPDISYAVAAHSRYNSRPFTCHMTAGKRVHQYLKSKADFRLRFTGNGIGICIDIHNCLVGYSDSDWANGSADHKSQGVHVFLTSSRAVSWQSQQRGLIRLSTIQAEFYACSEVSRETQWLPQL